MRLNEYRQIEIVEKIVSYTPTITREERRAHWNTYKIEDNGSVKLFQVRQQDHKWYLRIVCAKRESVWECRPRKGSMP
jgi:hypothetical protein